MANLVNWRKTYFGLKAALVTKSL